MSATRCAIDNVFSKLSHIASNSELLQQHGATITRSGYRPVVAAMGYNHYVACRYSTDKPSDHAEKVALTKFRQYYQSRAASDAKIRRKLKKTSILVARLNSSTALADVDGCNHTPQFRNSAPCYNCTALLKAYGVRKVIFTTDGGEPHCQKGKSAR